MILLLLGLCQAAKVTQIATPNKDVVDPTVFHGLSSLFLFGDFEDLDLSNYQVKLGVKECDLLSVKLDEIECIIPPWHDIDDEIEPELKVLHNSVVIYSESNVFSYGQWPLPLVVFNPNEAVARDTVNFYFLKEENYRENINHLAIQGVDMTLDSAPIEASRPYIINVELGNNAHGDHTLEYSFWGEKRGFLWVGGYTVEGTEYPFRVVASVESISVNLGNETMIAGESFPSETSRIRVELDGTECHVTQASFSSIKCTNGIYSDVKNSEYYQGSAGLVRETYTQGNIRVGSELVNREVISSATILTTTDSYDSLIYGLFSAPRTGDYTFYASFRGSVRVYLSSDSSSSNKQEVINSSQ